MPNWKKVITSGSKAHLNQITASSFQFVGSGNAELEVQGHITASGNISGSSTSTLSIGGTGSFGAVTATGTISSSGFLVSEEIFTRHISAIGNITGSKISSSGAFVANSFTIANGGTINNDGGVASFRVKGQNDDNLIFTNTSGNDKVGIGVAPDATLSKLQITGDLSTTSHITASGNISSSGTLTTDDITQLNVKKSELTGSYGTVHGAFNINYGNATTFSASLASAGDGYGEIISHLGINGASAGDVVYHSGGDWRPTDADNENTSNGMIGVALADGGGTSVPGPVLIRGMVRLAAGHVVGTTTDGDPLYLSPTAGHVQYAVPGSGDFARIVGYSIDGDNDIIYFNPSSTFVEVS